MAGLEQEKSQIGVTTPTIGVQRFRTNDMPDPGAATLAGTQKLAGTIQGINDQTMKDEADKAAQEEAGKAVIAKDANGNYLYPPAPDTFGSYARKAYEGLVDAQYKNQVVQDAQLQFNQIATDHALDPATAMQKMDAYRQGVMQQVDPRFAGPIQASLTHELAERQHGLLQTNFALDRKNAIDSANTKISSNIDQALERYGRGDTTGGDALMDENLTLKRMIEAQKGGDVDLGAEETLKTSMQTTGVVLKTLRDKVTSGEITQDQLDSLIMRLNGFTNDKAGPILGVTDQVIADGIKNPAVLKLLRGKTVELRSELTQVFANQKADATYKMLMQPYLDGMRGPVGNVGPDAQDQLINTWADKTLKGGRFALQSADGALAAFQQFGMLPSKSIKSTFEGVKGNDDPKMLEQKYGLWKQLDRMPGGNGMATSMRGPINAEDDAYMQFYDRARDRGAQPLDAMKQAKDAMEPANHAIATGGLGGLIKTAGSPTYANDPNMDEAKLYSEMDKHLPMDWSRMLPGGYHMKDLPKQVQNDMVALVNQRLSQPGTNLAQAMDWAGSNMLQLWRPDPKTQLGWTRGADHIPQVIGPDGHTSSGYTEQYWNLARDSGKFMLSGGYKIPATAREGKDIFYAPNGNGTFNVFYRDPQQNILAVVDHDSHAPLVMDFRNASTLQRNGVLDKRKQYEADRDLVSGEDARVRKERVIRENHPFDPMFDTRSAQTTGAPDLVMDVAKAADPAAVAAARERLKSYAVPTDKDPNDPDAANGVGWMPAKLGDVVRPPADPTQVAPGRIDKPTKGKVPLGGGDVSAGDGSEAIKVRPGVDLRLRPEVRAVMDDVGTAFPALEFTSGYRDSKHNAAVGGAQGSQHMHANAFDVSLRGLSIAEKGQLMDHITQNPLIGGIGYYPNSDSMHIDLRTGHAAWGGNRSRSSLPDTPDWYQRRIIPWLNGRP